MRKEELRQLKRINATPLMVKLAKENELKEPIYYKSKWSSTRYQKSSRYDMFIRCQTRGRLLMVCIFFPDDLASGIKEPTYEIYINPEGNEFTTRILHKGREIKWTSAKFENLGKVFHDTEIGSWYLDREEIDARIWQNPEGKKTIQSFLDTKEKGWRGIKEWQGKARDEKIRQQEERQQKPWDEDMALVPDVLPGFKRWSQRDATKEHFIFYDYEKSGAKAGYCSYCEKQVPITKPKHNMETVCPCCKKPVIFKVASKIQTLSRESYITECIQRMEGGLIIRTFKNYCAYRNRTPDNPDIGMWEEERYLLFDNGTVRHYTWGNYKNKKIRWIPAETRYYRSLWGRKPILYTKNITQLKKTVLKESAIDLWPKLPCGTAEYLFIERGNPAVEKLARLKMFKLAQEIMEMPYDSGLLRQEETELAKLLKIDKARLKRLKKMHGNVTALKWLQYEKLANTMWPDEMIKDFGKSLFAPSSAFGFLQPPMHYVKIWNYLKKQSQLSGDTMAQVRITWSDYINMAEQAKWNVKTEQILYPKNLDAAHSEVMLFLQGASMEKQAKDLEKKWPKVNEILPGIKKFEYTSGKYQIVTPNEILDIVKEGTALRHCVHTCDFYFDRIQKNETYLFFLRKSAAPEAPWYTLEVEPSGNIRQKRTTGDNQNRDFQEAVPFLKEWQQVFASRLTKEEKELGILADQARIKEYKELRKNGNKVWHGRLAGKLLVDVLEADFMAVAT